MKATHKGTCQVCGAIQKLPNGTLAKHGYSVEDSCFYGVCGGSCHLPYERSCEIVAQSIQRTQKEVEKLQGQISEISSSSGPETWAYVYARGVGMRWVYGVLEQGMQNSWMIRSHCNVYKTSEIKYHDEETARVQLNNRRIQHLEREIRKFSAYIVSQQVRVQKWEERPLLSIV